jgi:excisionase family DNA binding protein
MIKDRVTVQEAARRLGVKDDAIRKRIQRGTLDYEKDPDGRVYVYLDKTEDEQEADAYRSTQDTSYDALVAAKDETIQILGEQLEEERDSRRRADTLIAQLMQTNAALASRVPELEAASTDPPDLRGSSSATDEAQSAADHRSWWRRLLGE